MIFDVEFFKELGLRLEDNTAGFDGVTKRYNGDYFFIFNNKLLKIKNSHFTESKEEKAYELAALTLKLKFSELMTKDMKPYYDPETFLRSE